MIDSLRNTYHPSFSLFLSSVSASGFLPRVHVDARVHRRTFHVSVELRAATKYARSRAHEGCVVYDKYEIPSADYVLLSFAWVCNPPSLRIAAVSLPEKRVAGSCLSHRPSGLFRQFIDDPRYRRSAATLESLELSVHNGRV